MKQLKKEFTGTGEVKGFEFKQIKASPYAYIYEVTNKDFNDKISDNPKHWHKHYEVFEHQEYKRFDMVMYPRSNAFGKWAKTTRSLDKANELFATMENDMKRRELNKLEI